MRKMERKQHVRQVTRIADVNENMGGTISHETDKYQKVQHKAH